MWLALRAQVFFMDPEHGCVTTASTSVVFAQITVPAGTSFQGSISAQGKGTGEDWTVMGMTFTNAAAPPPPPPAIVGCTNRAALNYNPRATVDDGSCRMPPPPPPPAVRGCTDRAAVNYNPQATLEDGSCRMPPPPPPTPPPPSPSGGPVVQVVQTSGKPGYTTYQVSVQFGAAAQDVYALFGEAGAFLDIPPAFQVAAPFGSDVGPVSQLQRLLIAVRVTPLHME